MIHIHIYSDVHNESNNSLASENNGRSIKAEFNDVSEALANVEKLLKLFEKTLPETKKLI